MATFSAQQVSALDMRRYASIEDMRVIYEVSNAKYNGRGWQEFGHFGTKGINPTWGNIVKEGQLIPKASNIAVGANKPLRSTAGWESYGGSIYKMGHGVAMDEADMLRIRQLASGNRGKFAELMLDTFVTKSDILAVGIHNQITSLSYKAIFEGYIYDASVDGTIIKEDMRIPGENKGKTAKSWFDFANDDWKPADDCDPVQDLLDAQDAADNLPVPVPYDHWKVTKKMYKAFINHPKVIDKCRARINGLLNANVILSEQEKLQYIHELGVVPFLVIDEKSAIEIDGDLKVDAKSACDKNLVLCQSGTNLLEIKPMASIWEDVNEQAKLGPESNFSFIGEQGIIAVLNQWDVRQSYNRIEAEAWATPVLTNPKNILIYSADQTYVYKTDENIDAIVSH